MDNYVQAHAFSALYISITRVRLQALIHQVLSGTITAAAFLKMSFEEAKEPSAANTSGAATSSESPNEQSLEDFLAAHLAPAPASATVTTTTAQATTATSKRVPLPAVPASNANTAGENRASDTTDEHKTHLYDANCRICRGLEAPSGRLRGSLLLKSAASSSEPTPSASVSPSEASSTPQQLQHQQQQQPSAADAKAHAEEVNRLFAERFMPKSLPQPPPTPTSGTPDDTSGSGNGNGGPGSSLFPRPGPGPQPSQQIAWKGQVTMSDVAAYPSIALSVSGQIRPAVCILPLL